MSEKHTPGPWRVRHRHYDAGPNEDEIGGLGWELEGPPEPMRGHFALAADAHLVAAAPDLLEAAQYARALIEAGLALQVLDPTQLILSPDGDYELEWAEALEQLKAAIKRAALTGGETGETE